MIEYRRCYVSGNQVFPTLEAAQVAELDAILPAGAGQVVIENRDKVLDILTTTDASRPKARSINGGKKRKPKDQVQPAPAEETQPALV